MRLALCQMNPTVGDIAGNAARIRAGLSGAREAGPISCCSESLPSPAIPPRICCCASTSSQTRKPRLLDLAAETHGVVAIVGFPEQAEHLYNAAIVLADGAVQAIYRKVHLPNYGVFDERRYFQAGDFRSDDRDRRAPDWVDRL